MLRQPRVRVLLATVAIAVAAALGAAPALTPAGTPTVLAGGPERCC